MNRSSLAALLGGVLLAGCAVIPPTGPTALSLPPAGKPLAQFQQEDAGCRNYAFNQIGVAPAQAANQSVAGGAVAGTAIGAATGALLGAAGGSAGAGAAVGAGAGLLAGSAIGAGQARTSSYALQARYDQAYVQCMASAGNGVQLATVAPYAPYHRGYPYYGYGPGFFGPSVSLGFGFGGFGHRRHF